MEESEKTIKLSDMEERRAQRAEEVLQENYQRIDRFFAILMPLQWIGTIALSLTQTPYFWNGSGTEFNPKVISVVILGGIISIFPVFLAMVIPGKPVTRYVISAAQILMSSLLIHVTGGRLETHFHVFGSLAFLALYLDWRVLIPATVITTADHIFRGILFPQSIYGVVGGAEWRWVEHTAWVLFEDIFLVLSCLSAVRSIKKTAEKNTNLEISEGRNRAIFEQMTDGLFLVSDDDFIVIDANKAFANLLGYETPSEVKGIHAVEFDNASHEQIIQMTSFLKQTQSSFTAEREYKRRDGSEVSVEITGTYVEYAGTKSLLINVKAIAERKKQYLELKRLALVAEQTQTAMMITDENGLIAWVNSAFKKMHGINEDVIGIRPNFLYGEDTKSESKAEIREAVKARKAYAGEVYLYRADGRGIWVALNLSPIFDSKQLFRGYISSSNDISEKKTAAVENRRLALVAQKTQNLVVIANADGRIEWVNDAFTRITGYTLPEVIGKKPGSFLQGEKTSLETVERIRHAQRTKTQFEGEVYNYAKDGRGFWLSISLMPIQDEQGNHHGFIAVESDITERKAMENALVEARNNLEKRVDERTVELSTAYEAMKAQVSERERAEREASESKHFLSRVIDSVPNLIFVKDSQGRYVLCNQIYARLHGRRPEEITGRTDLELGASPEDLARYRESDNYVFENCEERVEPDESFVDSAGTTHWFHTVKRPLVGDEGVEYIIGIATDFTERKLLESQLRHAQKLESIGQLAAGIAHEINTPTQYVGDNLRFIRDSFKDINETLAKYDELFAAAKENNISADLLKEIQDEVTAADLEYLEEELPKAIDQSLDGVTRIGQIVQSMKDFAHPGSKDKVAADLNRAIESTVTVARNEWKYVADVDLNFDKTLPPVPCHLGELNQVILNMVINASHAIADVVGDGSHGKGKITITTTKMNDEWAEIRITDTGTGIPESARRKVFDPFFTTKAVGKGTGQGLAISHTVVVDQHRGKLNFETEDGKGTTFIIQLPINDKQPNDGAERNA